MKTEAESGEGRGGFQIRAAHPQDGEAIAALIERSVRALNLGDYTAAQIESILAHGIVGLDRQLIADGTLFVAEEAGPQGAEIVGCGGWSFRRTLYGCHPAGETDDTGEPLDPATEAARIRAFFVRPDRTRRGIGRALLAHSEAAARRAGFLRFELAATPTGVPLYTACGYHTLEAVEDTLPDGQHVWGVRMEKSPG